MSNWVISLEDDRLDNQNTNKNNSVHDEAFIAQKIIELTNIQLNGVATFLSIIF